MIGRVTLLPLLLATWMAQNLPAFELSGPKTAVQTISRNPTYTGYIGTLEEPLFEMMKRMAGDSASSKQHVASLLSQQNSYDFNAHLESADLLFRWGFNLELHNCTSSDGYVTQLVRIINPKIERSALRQTPVVLYAGQGASAAVFLMAAIGSGHPLPWPREKDWLANGPSGNRSIALTLANNGYDVWLVPARGVDLSNQKRTEIGLSNDVNKWLYGGLLPRDGHFTYTPDGLRKLIKSWEAQQYWSFSDDQIIKHEFGNQLRLVLKLAGCEKLSLINYSNGGFVSFAFMAHEPEFAHLHLDSVISVAPAVFVDVKSNLVLGASGLLSTLAPLSRPYPDGALDVIGRRGFASFCKPKTFRYSVCKLLLDQLYGHSQLFNTHLELSILDYIGRPLSARGLRQSLQVGLSGRLSHYDRGPICNLLEYQQIKPPTYDLSRIRHERLFIISGSNDAIVSHASITRLLAQLSCRPRQLINIPGYNHLDLLAAYDNTDKVNMPILSILDDRSIEENYYREELTPRDPEYGPTKTSSERGTSAYEASRNEAPSEARSPVGLAWQQQQKQQQQQQHKQQQHKQQQQNQQQKRNNNKVGWNENQARRQPSRALVPQAGRGGAHSLGPAAQVARRQTTASV